MELDWDVVRKKDKKKKLDEVPTKLPQNHTSNSRDPSTSRGNGARPHPTRAQTPNRPSLNGTASLQPKKSSNLTPKQPGILDFKLIPNNPFHAQQKRSQGPNAKPTTKVTLFDLILTSKKDKSESLSMTAPKAVTFKPKPQDDLKPKNFIANKKKRRVVISTVKKRILMVHSIIKYKILASICKIFYLSTGTAVKISSSFGHSIELDIYKFKFEFKQ